MSPTKLSNREVKDGSWRCVLGNDKFGLVMDLALSNYKFWSQAQEKRMCQTHGQCSNQLKTWERAVEHKD